MRSITVLIADRESKRTGVCRTLLRGSRGVRIVNAVTTIREALDAVKSKPDIMLLDLKMTEGADNPAVPLIRSTSPTTHIILLTGRASEGAILNAIAHGARGYLGSTLLRRFLPKAVRAVAAGESWVSRAMVSKLIDRLARLETR